MSRSINFLRERRRQLTKQELQDRRIFRITLIGFGVILVVCGVVFGVRFSVANQVEQLQQGEKATRQQLSERLQDESAFVIFDHKLTNLVLIDQDKQDKKAVINAFTKLFDNRVRVTAIEFNQKDRLLTFHLQSPDAFILKSVFAAIDRPEVQQQFYSISPSSLQRGSDGKYELRVTVSTQRPPTDAGAI